MEKRMESVVVLVREGNVVISQTVFGDDPSEVFLAPGQIDLLIEWLKEAKEDALKGD